MRISLISVLVLTLALFQSTAVFAHTEALKKHERARKLVLLSESSFVHNETDSALKFADEAIRCDPQFPSAYSLRGCILARKNLFARAANDLNRAITLAPKDEELLINQGIAYYDAQNDFRNSISVYTKALSINPTNTRALALRALAFEHLGDGCRAIKDLNRAINISPQDANLFGCRGLILKLQQRYKESLVDYAWAAKLQPTNPYYLQGKAHANLFLGHAVGGLQDINKAIKLNSKDAYLHITRAQLLTELGNFTESIRAYDNAEKLGATHIIDARAEAKMDAGKYREALVDWTREINDYPTCNEFFLAKRGKCFIELELWDQALIDLNRSVSAGGDYPFVHKWRAQVYKHFGECGAAIKDLTYALTFFDNGRLQFDPERAQILLERARIQGDVGKYDLVLIDLITAEKYDQKNMAIYLEFFILCKNYIFTKALPILFSPESLFLIAFHGTFRSRKIRRLL